MGMITKPKECLGQRHVFSIIAFFGMASLYGLRVNMALAIVSMTKPDGAGNYDESNKNVTNLQCPHLESSTSTRTEGGEFTWSSYEQGIVMSSFFWGYVILQIPSGILIERYGWSSKWLFGSGVLASALLNLLTPLCARLGIHYLIANRSLMGFLQGAAFPSIQSLVARWIPSSERSFWGGLIYAGMPLGTVLGQAASGWLAGSGLFGGWPSIFYVFGMVGLFWFAIWAVFASDYPSSSTKISDEEKQYIISSTGFVSTGQEKHVTIPWKHILRSGPVWAIVSAHSSCNWGFEIMLSQLPTFLKQILRYDIRQNGMLSALPFICMWFVMQASTLSAAAIERRSILTTAQNRKLFNTIGTWIPAGLLLILTTIGCNRAGAIAILSISVGLNGALVAGFQMSHIDLSINYAGFLMGITNFFGNVMGIVAPYVAGSLVDAGQDFYHWNIIFYLTAVIQFVGNGIFILLGSAEEQDWNKIELEPVQEKDAKHVNLSFWNTADDHSREKKT